MDYSAAAYALVWHHPRHRPRFLRRFLVERCRVCGGPYPCADRRQAKQIILDTLNSAGKQ